MKRPPTTQGRSRLRQRLVGAALLAPALAAPGIDAAHASACSTNAVLCCGSPAQPTSVKAMPPSFGVHIWPADLQSTTAIAQLLALHPRHLRFAIGPNWRRQPQLAAGMTDAEIDAAVDAGLDGSHFAAEIDVLQRLHLSTGAALHLVIWEPPPLPGEANRREATQGRRLRSEDVTLAARFYVALLKRVAGRGLQLEGVELSNEPDGNWNIRIAPADYLSLVKAVRAQGKRRRVTLPKIYGPAASSVAAARTFFRDPKLAQGILDSVDVFSVHGWDNSKAPDRFIELDALLEDLRRLGRRPELAITEYGLARPVPSDTSDRMNVKVRSPDSIANTPFYGSISARDLLRFCASGASTVIHWEFRDESWGKASFGLLDARGHERPIYRMIRDVSKYLADSRPRRIVPTTVNGLFVAEQTDRDVLWSANPMDHAVSVVLADGTQLAKNAPQGLGRCQTENGKPGFVAPPWSVMSVPIKKP